MAGGGKNAVSNYKYGTDKAKDAACKANSVVLSQQIQMWRMSHSGDALTRKALEDAQISIPKCPEGGDYIIENDGTIYCPVHNPPPAPSPAPPTPPTQPMQQTPTSAR